MGSRMPVPSAGISLGADRSFSVCRNFRKTNQIVRTMRGALLRAYAIGRFTMKRFSILSLATVALVCLIALPSGDAIGQTKITKDQLVGTWSFASVVIERGPGPAIR